MAKFLDKIAYTVDDTEGKVTFFSSDNSESSWSCYPAFNMSGEEFLVELAPLVKKHGWITPWDCQERACREGLASYSKRKVKQ